MENLSIKENTNTKKVRRKENLKESPNFRIIRDTREKVKKGWFFEESVRPSSVDNITILSDTLDAGDYSLVGYDLPNDDDSIIIERKASVDELLGNIGTNWERFKTELEQLSKYKHAYLIIEDDMSKVLEKYESIRVSWFNISPAFIITRVSHIEMNFNVKVKFLTNRLYAQRFVLNLFKHIRTKHES